MVGASDRVALHEPELKGREIEYLSRCIETGWVSYAGEYVTQFEADLARISQVAHAVAMVNGTVALHAALLIAGVKPGDEVLVPTLTFAATAEALASRSGLRLLPDRIATDWPATQRVQAAVTQPPAQALDETLRSIDARYGSATADFVAMQLEYPR